MPTNDTSQSAGRAAKSKIATPESQFGDFVAASNKFSIASGSSIRQIGLDCGEVEVLRNIKNSFLYAVPFCATDREITMCVAVFRSRTGTDRPMLGPDGKHASQQ